MKITINTHTERFHDGRRPKVTRTAEITFKSKRQMLDFEELTETRYGVKVKRHNPRTFHGPYYKNVHS